MINDKRLKAIYDNAKGDNKYYTFGDFKDNAKDFLKDVKKRNTYCSIKPSKSGMSRKFNFYRYNMLLNICYNGKFEWEHVNVRGCGMDMHWYLKFRTCEMLLTKKELDKGFYNSLCSGGIIL